MAKKERSFFGKIMGGSITDEEDQVETPESYSNSQSESTELEEELIEEEFDVEEEDDAEEAGFETYQPQVTASSPESQPVMATSKPAKGEEEWMNDFEGQLNIDMFQTKDNVIIKSTIAGVRPEDIDITVANDMVSIKGARRKEDSVPQEDYFYQECYWGNFSRSVIVPVDIDSEQIEADLKDGILTVIIPKAAKAKTKKVKVKGL
jgi:HSP20 family protein